MSFSIDDRVLAVAGIAQALQQVRRIAETGHSDAAVARTAMDSVLRIDAPSPAAVYGDMRQLEPGLRLLRDYFRNQGNVAAFLADLMETHFALAADPAIAPLRNIQNAADAYPRKRLIDYLSSRAPQL